MENMQILSYNAIMYLYVKSQTKCSVMEFCVWNFLQPKNILIKFNLYICIDVFNLNIIRIGGMMFFTKRFSVVFALSVMYSVFSYAIDEVEDKGDNQNGFVVGVYAGGSSMKIQHEYYKGANKNDELPGDYEKNLLGASYGIKAGYDVYFLPSHGVRIYLDYMHSYFNNKDSSLGIYSMHTTGINADYRFNVFGFNVFAGAGLAYNAINTKYLGSLDTFGGSVNAGLSYTLLSFIELEFRVRYLIYDIPEKSSSNLVSPIPNETIKLHFVELESPINFHLGVNVKF